MTSAFSYKDLDILKLLNQRSQDLHRSRVDVVLIHSAVLKDDSKDLPYTRYTALAAVGGTDGEISVHRFTVSNEL